MEEFNEEEMLQEDRNKYTKITELNIIIEQQKKRIEELKGKAKAIKENLEREETDKVNTTKTMQAEWDKKDKAIKDLEANIEKLELHMADNKEQREQKYKVQIAEIKKLKEEKLEETILVRSSQNNKV